MSPTVGRISTRSEEETIIKAKQTDFRSAAPMWAALSVAVIWLAYALLFPLYRVSHFLIVGVISAVAFLLLTALDRKSVV